jgi:hypothetical protein
MSIIIEDTFVDVDGTLLTNHTIGPTNIPGATWSSYGTIAAIASIQSNTANLYDFSDPIPSTLLVDSGHADVTVTVTMTYPNTAEFQGFFARFVDNTNGFYCGINSGLLIIGQVIAGSYSFVASTAFSPTIGVPLVYTMQASGSNYTLSQGATQVTYSSSTGATGTKQGLITGQSALGDIMLYNDFIVSIPSAPDGWIAPFTNNITRYEENFI